MSILCIDVSENNGQVDWDAVIDAGIEGAIVRAGFGVSGTEDSMFRTNLASARSHGLHVGAYWYSYALNPIGAATEGTKCRKIIEEEGGVLDLPVFFDMEDADGYKRRNDFNFNREHITAMCQEFIRAVGLNCGVYASRYWLDNYIDWPSLGCSVWNAEWNNTADPNDDCDFIQAYAWQFTNEYIIGGRAFDCNVFRI